MHGRWDHHHTHSAPLGHNAPSGDAAQWQTPHLQSMGAVEIARSEYLKRLAIAVVGPSAW